MTVDPGAGFHDAPLTQSCVGADRSARSDDTMCGQTRAVVNRGTVFDHTPARDRDVVPDLAAADRTIFADSHVSADFHGMRHGCNSTGEINNIQFIFGGHTTGPEFIPFFPK